MKFHAANTITSGEVSINRPIFTLAPDMSRVSELRNSDERQALDFLAVRPVHTVVMTSFIEDNGIESPSNRGKFYAYRNEAGGLEGIALIGHTTLIETRSEKALKALAFAARHSEVPIYLMMSEGRTAEAFWSYYNDGLRNPRLVCTEMLFEIGFPFPVQKCEYDIRPARPEELEQIAYAQAEIALLESGVDPMERDREGFLGRVLRRIRQGRIFVVVEEGKLVFKVDVIAQTANVAYLEGVYVSPERRGEGIGSNCLSNVSIRLLDSVQNVCLLSNAAFHGAHSSFRKAGFKNTGKCTTVFL